MWIVVALMIMQVLLVLVLVLMLTLVTMVVSLIALHHRPSFISHPIHPPPPTSPPSLLVIMLWKSNFHCVSSVSVSTMCMCMGFTQDVQGTVQRASPGIVR